MTPLASYCWAVLKSNSRCLGFRASTQVKMLRSNKNQENMWDMPLMSSCNSVTMSFRQAMEDRKILSSSLVKIDA